MPDADDSEQPLQAGVGALVSDPAMPFVPAYELYIGPPRLLVPYGHRHSIGWQDTRKAGPSFVVARVGPLESAKVVERFPLTEGGWAEAWQALVRCDPAAAKAAAATLAARAVANRGRARLAKLDAKSLACLPAVAYLGGYTAGPELGEGTAYDLRFLADRLMVCPAGSAEATMELAYTEIDAVDVGGPGQVKRWSTGGQIGLTLAFGLPGAVAGIGSTTIQTIVRINAGGSEMFFLHTQKLADALRIELSVALKAIREARADHAHEPDGESAVTPESITGQLARLASMMDNGLLTRDEFDHLKAKLIAET